MSLNAAAPQLHPNYRPDIDGLRAIAVLLVIAFHYFPGHVPGGFVGVDIFFVISGFLISAIVFGNLERGSFSYAQFYARRIRRIFPALVVVSTGALAFGWFVLLGDEFLRLGKHVAAGAAFVSNVALWMESGYFDADAALKPLLHLWSLGIEEQFYIFWPPLLGFVWKYQHKLLPATLAVAVLSFGINLYLVPTSPTAAYYSPATRSWELMAGGILAYANSRSASPAVARLFSLPNLQSALALVFIAASAMLLSERSIFPGWRALFPVLGAVLFISAGQRAWLNRHVLSNGWLVRIGLISYPLYLWHWPLFSFARICTDGQVGVALKLTLIASTIVLAQFTYQYVERPLRNARGARALPLLIAAMAAVFGIGLAIAGGRLPPRNSAAFLAPIIQATSDWDFPRGWETYNLSGSKFFIKRALPSTTVFVGDSNVEQYAPRIAAQLQTHATTMQTAILATEGGCSIIPALYERQRPQCSEKMRAAMALTRLPEVRTVVFGQSWLGYESELGHPAVRASLAELIRSTAGRKQVYLLLNMPSGHELDPHSMYGGSRLTRLYRRANADTAFSYQAFEKRYAATRESLSEIAGENGAIVIDPIVTLCPNHECPVVDPNGHPLYKDGSHMTATYARESASFIDTTLVPGRLSPSASSGAASR